MLGRASRPQTASFGSYVHIVWEAEVPTRTCVNSPICPDNYYIRSTNGGITFEPVQLMTDYTALNGTRWIGRPEVTVLPASGTVMHVCQYAPLDNLANMELYAQVFAANGARGSGSGPVRITN